MYEAQKARKIFNKYQYVLSMINIFEYEDLMQEYELYMLEHKQDDCFDYFIKNVLRKSFKRKSIIDELNAHWKGSHHT